ncbi:MAG: fimbrial biogenesis outer membrane usher protein [Rudaea sp.]|uniref:fimbria/pilus outer membrane usher protein n=1 Tax=unclassified Rudaea TaxID=2627037 RepID=UPI0010F9B10F|nr:MULTISPECIES: fimbria/pilus outer membrane usher protein [unclassified Rudaea]MBN8887082.1 fimbrial biogenesis outer membrane usher protein [Rudaea sp.]MBR0344745.1 fimbrial biogenesis outer membrane usher protein [Rudaea sp.]
MVKKRRKPLRWPIRLVEATLLYSSLSSLGFALEVSTGAADAAAPAAIAGYDAAGDAAADTDGGSLYLEVTVNGADKGLGRFSEHDGAIYASAAALRSLGFTLPSGAGDPLRVDSLAGVKTKYDAGRQALSIDAPLGLLDLPSTVLNAQQNSVPRVTTSPGALLNYDLYGTIGEHGAAGVNAFTELRAFDRFGVLSFTSLAQATHDDVGGWTNNYRRLDTTWTTSFPEQMLSLRIGDTITDALSWSRATRIGGIQFGTDFALQPYRITAPLPAFFGSAALPSDVQLYINGVKQYSGQVPAGPFQLNAVPNVNGVGNAQIVVTDALGRATTLNFSMYNTQQLLAQGLSDWSVELGAVRENYGLSSFDYAGKPMASGTWRYGFSNSFTAEAHAETSDGLSNAGAGGSVAIGSFGVVSAAYARSDYHGSAGSLVSLNYDWRSDIYYLNLGGTRTSGNYRDVASLSGSPPPRISAHAQGGLNTADFGSFSVGYLHLREIGKPASRYANASWFKAVGSNASLGLSLNQNLDTSKDRSVFFSFSFALGGNTSVSTGLSRDNGRDAAVVSASRSTPMEGGIGWRASLSAGEGRNGGQAELDYLGGAGRYSVGVSALGDSRYAYADVTGSLVFMDGHLFAARHIDDAFAVVSTDGIADVPVKLENRVLGKTDTNGLMLITPLNAYQNNQLAIDPMNLPADVRIDRVKTFATPGDRSGTLVRFGITPIRAATIVLVDAAGKPLALGSEVRLAGQTGDAALVGYDGIVYLDTLETHNVLDVQGPGGACRAEFDYRKEGDGVPQIGPLPCRKEKP